MSEPPAQPKIYHISHGRNLVRILSAGCLCSEAEMNPRGGPEVAIGMSEIKARRLNELPLSCHPGTRVGEYVPFYFCPRSVMLYILHMGNHPGLTYKEGQRPIVHLEADIHEVVSWAESQNRRWAFTDRNAGCGYFQSFSDLAHPGSLTGCTSRLLTSVTRWSRKPSRPSSSSMGRFPGT